MVLQKNAENKCLQMWVTINFKGKWKQNLYIYSASEIYKSNI